MDSAVGAKTFENEPTKVFVDKVGEVYVRDLRYTGNDGDEDEDGF